MIIVKLREAMMAHLRRTGERVTYRTLAERTGLAAETLAVIGGVQARSNPTLATIDKICAALDVSVEELLERVPDPPDQSAR